MGHKIKRILPILKDTWHQMEKAHFFMVASSLAYTTILSIIPLLAVSFAIFKAFGGMQKLYAMLEPLIISSLAEGASQEAIQTLHQFIDNAHTSAIGIGGFLGLVFTSISMLSSAEKAINQVWHVPIGRTIFHRIATYWLIITLGPLLIAVVFGAAKSFNFPIFHPTGFGGFLTAIVIFSCVYKWVPHCRVRYRYALISGTATAIIWNIAKFGYLLYARKAVSYSNIYGSLGAVPLLLLWIYIVWIVILGGAALTAAMQKQLERK